MHYPESSCLPEFPAIEREGWGLHDGGPGVNACCSYYSLVVRNPALWLVGSIHSGHYCSILLCPDFFSFSFIYLLAASGLR